MAKSGPDKARIIPYVKPGLIIDAGAGGGIVTELLRRAYLDSTVRALDLSDDMIKRLTEKFKDDPKVIPVKHDIINYDPGEPVDTYVHTSNLHEVGSFAGREAIIATLRNEYKHLKEGGRVVIRDGVRPPDEVVFVKAKTDFGADRFVKFIEGFKKVREVEYSTGTFDPDTLEWKADAKGAKIIPGKTFIRFEHAFDASEMFSKYHYPEVNLPVEFSEEFGMWNLADYKNLLIDLGFKIVHAEEYLIPYLLENHYSVDYDYFHLVGGVLSNANYPSSTMILVGEK
jgi:SAM-dependent methyltransferase